jgi:hypothetical protein
LALDDHDGVPRIFHNANIVDEAPAALRGGRGAVPGTGHPSRPRPAVSAKHDMDAGETRNCWGCFPDGHHRSGHRPTAQALVQCPACRHMFSLRECSSPNRAGAAPA